MFNYDEGTDTNTSARHFGGTTDVHIQTNWDTTWIIRGGADSGDKITIKQAEEMLTRNGVKLDPTEFVDRVSC